mmetsp:Transcript_36807/g.59517  ORF Transcript_36807/g.59517 Transcript_36807/m.59517 type:complete len:449 (+) Transcript_36807:134-1480(+)|eukprot:CAMPEP_0184656644 /NCGR_PEP_ID=MMETSP0308-20130426/16650_1 /TAXON_ID=38269 /ORGANISM="Gloeochaete witrockiana, Strain SAG 46.84" /LENGTH=448 /DNA_ID=CAMNT_0027093863 /DNA_START=58 /DNA_END=1404 /DNA_ORIENTATION=+
MSGGSKPHGPLGQPSLQRAALLLCLFGVICVVAYLLKEDEPTEQKQPSRGANSTEASPKDLITSNDIKKPLTGVQKGPARHLDQNVQENETADVDSGQKSDDETSEESSTPVIPVYQIFYGELPYFAKFSIAASVRTNRRVIVIGASSDGEYIKKAFPTLEFYHIEDYQPVFDAWNRTIFPKEHERRNYQIQCFTRWFILRDHMQAHGIQEAFYQDSDTMLFVDVTKARPAFGNHELIMSQQPPYVAGHFAYVTLKGIIDLCDFTMNLFADNVFAGERKSEYFSDMTALVLYAFANTTGAAQPCWGVFTSPGTCNDHKQLMFRPRIKTAVPHFTMGALSVPSCGLVYDHKFDGHPGEKKVWKFDKFKKVTWINHHPHFEHRELGYVQVAGIHFQGGRKHIIVHWNHLPNHSDACMCYGKPKGACRHCKQIGKPVTMARDDSCPKSLPK